MKLSRSTIFEALQRRNQLSVAAAIFGHDSDDILEREFLPEPQNPLGGTNPQTVLDLTPMPVIGASPSSGGITGPGFIELGNGDLFGAKHWSSADPAENADAARPDADVLVMPTLVPGSGYAGPVEDNLPPVGDPAAAGYDAKVIARWDVVPYQTFDGKFNVGVVAFHMNGIEKVSFSVDGGPWEDVYQMTLNPQTANHVGIGNESDGVIEYWATLDASKFKMDGSVEVRAIAYPTVGQPRVLESLKLNVNSQGTLQQFVAYVSPAGHDSFGDGSVSNPYRTLMRAARAIQAAGDKGTADGGTIYLLAGEHTYGTYAFANKTTTADRWLTIRPAPGLTRSDVSLNASTTSGLRTRLVRVYDLTIKTSLLTSTPDEDHLWIDSCEMIGQGPTTTMYFAPSSWTSTFVTNSTVRDNDNGVIGSRLQRHVSARNLGSDAFSNSEMVIGSIVDGIDKQATDFHPDVYQFSGTGRSRENVIVYGMKAINVSAQGIFADDLAVLDNVAFVNVQIDSTNYSSQWKNVSTNHLLLWNVVLDRAFLWRAPGIKNVSLIDFVHAG